MSYKEIENKLHELRISPSLINWKGNTIPASRIWYSAEDNMMHSDCGVSLPFNYDIETQLYKCVLDIGHSIQRFYKEKGIDLEM
jgi:hypothetical protein